MRDATRFTAIDTIVDGAKDALLLEDNLMKPGRTLAAAEG